MKISGIVTVLQRISCAQWPLPVSDASLQVNGASRPSFGCRSPVRTPAAPPPRTAHVIVTCVRNQYTHPNNTVCSFTNRPFFSFCPPSSGLSASCESCHVMVTVQRGSPRGLLAWNTGSAAGYAPQRSQPDYRTRAPVQGLASQDGEQVRGWYTHWRDVLVIGTTLNSVSSHLKIHRRRL
jgi:hypothetical protein